MLNRVTNLKIGPLLLLNAGMIFLMTSAITLIAAINLAGELRGLVIVLGMLALGLNCFCAWWLHHRLAQPLQDIAALGQQISEGDLTSSFKGQASGELADIQRVLTAIKDSLFNIVRDVRSGSIAIDTTAGRVKNDTTTLSVRNEAQAGSLQTAAASMEELTSTVKNNDDKVVRANQLVESTSHLALKGGGLVKDVVSTMDAIKHSSHKIVDIISVIDGIAFQTNILALNAAVEAARAGEQGRGFAVVAAEVRSLSQRSANAAKEIKSLITDSVEKVDSGSKLVGNAGQTMEEIVNSVNEVAGFMSDIATSSREQSVGIAQVNETIAHFESMTEENAALVEQALKSAISLAGNASTLSQSVEHFKLGSEVGTAEEAKALVKKGIAFATANGLSSLIEDVNKLNKGQFVYKDLYLGIYSDDGTVTAHGANRHFIGSDAINTKDQDGKLFIRDMIAIGMDHGSGGLHYKFAHPVTQEIKTKAVYVEKFDNMVVTCGCYAS